MLFLTLDSDYQTWRPLQRLDEKTNDQLAITGSDQGVMMLNRKPNEFRWILVMLSLTSQVLMSSNGNYRQTVKISPNWVAWLRNRSMLLSEGMQGSAQLLLTIIPG